MCWLSATIDGKSDRQARVERRAQRLTNEHPLTFPTEFAGESVASVRRTEQGPVCLRVNTNTHNSKCSARTLDGQVLHIHVGPVLH